MKKSVALAALLVSATSAHAIIGPGPGPEIRKSCLKLSVGERGAVYAANCDSSEENKRTGVRLLANGCARGQALLQSTAVIRPCLRPGIVQL